MQENLIYKLDIILLIYINISNLTISFKKKLTMKIIKITK